MFKIINLFENNKKKDPKDVTITHRSVYEIVSKAASKTAGKTAGGKLENRTK